MTPESTCQRCPGKESVSDVLALHLAAQLGERGDERATVRLPAPHVVVELRKDVQRIDDRSALLAALFASLEAQHSSLSLPVATFVAVAVAVAVADHVNDHGYFEDTP
jgi:hypothetical protein